MTTNRPPQSTVLTTGAVSSEVSMLFRTKRVSEIRQIEANIRSEAEEKSDSLRILLSTRYKDLLQAADQIAESRDACSIHIRDSLLQMATSASKLREHFLRKGTSHVPASTLGTDDLERRKNVHIVGGKLKHIVDSPEVLYAHLESGQVYDAAVRYALAARNYEELRDTKGLEGVANRFAQQRWRQVQVFREQILAAGEKILITPGQYAQVCSRVVAALLILSEKDRNTLAILDGMLASRIAWIDDESRKQEGGVSTRLRRVALVVKESISCIRAMFWNEDAGGVEDLLREVDSSVADELRGLRESGALNSSCLKWIGDVRAWLEDHGRSILIAADTSRVLADTLRAIDEVFDTDTWPAVCKAVLKQPPKFVSDIFTPFISERASSVASESVRRTVDNVFSEFDAAWEDMSIGPHAGKLIWSAISSQAVGLKSDVGGKDESKAVTSTPSAVEESEFARSIACNNPAVAVINNFEVTLGDALSDITILTQRVPSVANAFDDSVRSCLPEILERLKAKLESIPETFTDDATSKDISCQALMEKALVIARTATALNCVESIKSAYLFCDSVLGSKDEKPTLREEHSTSNNPAFMKFQQAADELACLGYRTWANRLCLQLKEQLQTELTNENVLSVPTGWADGGSQYTNGGGEDVSGLRHPTTASMAVVNLLLRACKATNRAGGFALPDQAIHYLRQEMSHTATCAYQSAFDYYWGDLLAKQGSDTGQSKNGSSDAAVMQMLFDIQVLKELLGGDLKTFGTSVSKGTLKGIEQQLHAAMDPIDLASCRKPMQVAVESYASRTNILFGTITRNNTGRSSYLKRPLTTPSHLASSNLVTLSKTVPRFTYLPAPMPSTYSVTSGGTAGLSAKAALGALRSEATSVNGSTFRKREAETSVAGYASKVSESVGRFGRGFFESFTRKVG